MVNNKDNIGISSKNVNVKKTSLKVGGFSING